MAESKALNILRNNSAVFGLLIILLACLVAILGANIRPDKSRDANRQVISIARLKPLSTVKFLVIKGPEDKRNSFIDNLFFGGEAGSGTWIPFDSLHFRGTEIIYYPFSRVPVENPDQFRKGIPVTRLLNIPSDSSHANGDKIINWFRGKESVYQLPVLRKKILREHAETEFFLLGTDTFGRDLLSRIMGGTIVSLSVGVIAVLISLLLGVLLGGAAGYYRGWVENVIMWFVNVVWSVPTLLMVIAITVALGKGFTQVFIAVGFTMWVEVARVVRGQFIQLREKDYVMAARLMGFSDLRIMLRHMLPNTIGPLIVISAGNFSTAILLESGLSFLGVGTQVPMPSWGGIIKSHFNYITTDYAYLALVPGICLSILTLAFMLVGNALRDVLDVRSVQV